MTRSNVARLLPAAVSSLVLVVVLLVSSLTFAPRAEAYIYWTVGSSGSTIARANLDGSGVKPSFIKPPIPRPASSTSVSVNDTHVYFTAHEYWIGRANLDGSRAREDFIRTERLANDGVEYVAVNDSHVYWLPGFYWPIARANLDGSGVNDNFITPGPSRNDVGCISTTPLAVGETHIYWPDLFYPDSGTPRVTIARANLDGSGVNRRFIDAGPAPYKSSWPDDLGPDVGNIAVDSNYIYWTAENRIGRANLDGSGVNRSLITLPKVKQGFSSVSRPISLAVAGNHIYWHSSSQEDYDSRNFLIGRANRDGSGVNPSFIKLSISVRGANPCSTALAADLLDGVSGTASAKKTQKQKKKVRIKVKVAAKERLTAKVKGTVKVNPSYKLKPKSLQLAAGETKTIALKPKGKRAAKKIFKALKRGDKATAKLTVKLTDANRSTDSKKLRVRLRG